MADNPQNQEQSETSQQEAHLTGMPGETGKGEKAENNTPTLPSMDKLLSKIEKDLESVKENTKSDANVATLDRIEKAVSRIPDVLAESWGKLFQPGQTGSQEHKDATPSTPELKVDTPFKTFSVRKRGGRVVTRHVKDTTKDA